MDWCNFQIEVGSGTSFRTCSCTRLQDLVDLTGPGHIGDRTNRTAGRGHTLEKLTQPAEQLDPGNLEGTWALVAASMSFLPYLEKFSKQDSASINFPRNQSLPHMSYSRGSRIGNTCQFSSSNITLNGSSFTFDGSPADNSSAVFVQTSCPDCLIMRFTVASGNRLYLASRRRELEQNEIQEFKEQVQCLQMPPPTIMDPTKELCPWPEESRKD